MVLLEFFGGALVLRNCYLWKSVLQMGHDFLFLEELMRQERQKECPHSVVMGILKKEMQMGQLSYSGVSRCIEVG